MSALIVIGRDAELRALLIELLSDEGHTVAEVVPDGATSVARIRAAAPELILLDYALQWRDDAEEFLRTREEDPLLASIPLVVMTGFELPPVADGIAAVLRKPFDLDALVGAIRTVLDSRKRR